MSEIKKEGEIMWLYGASLYPDKVSADRHKKDVCGSISSEKIKEFLDNEAPVKRVRVTPEPEPEPERFYVETVGFDSFLGYRHHFKVRDRKYKIIVAEFYASVQSHDFVLEKVNIYATSLNETNAAKESEASESFYTNDGYNGDIINSPDCTACGENWGVHRTVDGACPWTWRDGWVKPEAKKHDE